MTTLETEPNICQNCHTDIGPLEFEMVGEEETQEVNYCPGCGEPVEEVLT